MESYSLHAVTSMMYSLDSLKLNDVFIRVFQPVAFCCPIISPFFRFFKNMTTKWKVQETSTLPCVRWYYNLTRQMGYVITMVAAIRDSIQGPRVNLKAPQYCILRNPA